MMNDEQWEELQRACVIFGESLARAAAAATEAIAIVAANLSDIMDDVCDHYEVDSMAELLQTIERLKETTCLSDYADDLGEIIIVKKLPRPPKRIGPINRANYTVNRPRRMARSNCHKKVR